MNDEDLKQDNTNPGGQHPNLPQTPSPSGNGFSSQAPQPPATGFSSNSQPSYPASAPQAPTGVPQENQYDNQAPLNPAPTTFTHSSHEPPQASAAIERFSVPSGSDPQPPTGGENNSQNQAPLIHKKNNTPLYTALAVAGVIVLGGGTFLAVSLLGNSQEPPPIDLNPPVSEAPTSTPTPASSQAPDIQSAEDLNRAMSLLESNDPSVFDSEIQQNESDASSFSQE